MKSRFPANPVYRFASGGLLAFILLLSGCQLLSGSQAPETETAIFRDAFVVGETGSWQLEGDEVSKVSITSEQLLVEVNAPDTVQFAALLEPTFDDFVLEADARLLSGDTGGSFGVLFRMEDPESFYRFEITGNGMYIIERHDPGAQWVRFVDEWRDTAAINQGLNANNRLKVVARGPAMTFYVNDILVGEISDSQYSNGNIAFDAGTFGRPQLRVAFDNVVITPP